MEPTRLNKRATAGVRNGPPALDMSGLQVGHWRVKHQAISRRRRAQWMCECLCGDRRVFAGTQLRSMPARGVEPCRACGRGEPFTKQPA